MTRRKSAAWHIQAIKQKTKQVGECWIWTGFISRTGYGQRMYRGKQARVHRLMYELAHGVELGPDDQVCHSCDVRLCCNPDHLWRGDNRLNAIDVVAKNRHYASLKTHCPRGHAYAEHGYTPPGVSRRDCKVCQRGRQRIKAGWPPELAYTPAVPKGMRPMNANYKLVRNPGRKLMEVCKRGHSMVGDGVYVAPNGNRQCAACRRLKRLEHEARARLASKITAFDAGAAA